MKKNKTKAVKRVLKVLLYAFLIFLLMMITPRMLGIIFPDNPPVGYHFDALTYLAIGTGLEKLIDLKPAIPENVEEIKDVTYKDANGQLLQLDFYRPKNKNETLPLLVFVHGGGWKGGHRSDYLPYLISYAQKGYMAATVSYRLKKDSLYPAAIEDIADAVDWLYQHGAEYKYDPDRMALIGGSAGAHLVLLASYGWGKNNQSDLPSDSAIHPRIRAVVDLYGPVDLTTPYALEQPLVTGFIGHAYKDKPALYLKASPVHYLKKSLPPTLIFHGTSDNLVPISQSDMLKQKLDSLSVPSEYYRIPLWPHAMDIGDRVNRFTQKKMDAFFEKYLSRVRD